METQIQCQRRKYQLYPVNGRFLALSGATFNFAVALG